MHPTTPVHPIDPVPRHRWAFRLLTAGLVVVVIGLVVAVVAVAGDPASPTPGIRERATSGSTSSTSPATSSTSSTAPTSPSVTVAVPGGSSGSSGSGGGSGTPGIGPRLRAPLAPISLPVGVDMGSFKLANTGDAALHLLHLDHPGFLSTNHDDPVPEVLPPGTTIEVSFGSFAPNLNDFTPGPWERVVHIESDGGDANIVVRGHAPVPGDLSAPAVLPPVPFPQGQGFWVEQVGGAPTGVEITVGPGLKLNSDPSSFTMGVNAKSFLGVSPCGRPASAVDKTIMRKVYLHVGGHGTHEVQVNWSIKAGPAIACAGQVI